MAVMDERSERIAQRFERPLLVAAVLTIPVTIFQLLPPADPWRTIADVLNWLIWLVFLTEAVVLCSLGGVIGLVLSFGLSLLLTKIMSVDFIFSPMINVGSLLFSSFLGILFGYVPAQRAAGLNPIDALRHE